MSDSIFVPRDVAQDALETLEANWYQIESEWGTGKTSLDQEVADGDQEPIRVLRELLAQPASEPKPVAHQIMWADDKTHYCFCRDEDRLDKISKDPAFLCLPLFTRPAPAGVVDMLRQALPFLEQHNDEGPTGEGWQSDELTDLVHAITVELNGAPK